MFGTMKLLVSVVPQPISVPRLSLRASRTAALVTALRASASLHTGHECVREERDFLWWESCKLLNQSDLAPGRCETAELDELRRNSKLAASTPLQPPAAQAAMPRDARSRKHACASDTGSKYGEVTAARINPSLSGHKKASCQPPLLQTSLPTERSTFLLTADSRELPASVAFSVLPGHCGSRSNAAQRLPEAAAGGPAGPAQSLLQVPTKTRGPAPVPASPQARLSPRRTWP